MAKVQSLLETLRTRYEATRAAPEPTPVADFHQIDAQMRSAFRWLEKAIAYLDELKLPLAHRFDVGHGIVFDAPRFNRGYVGQHERRVNGFPVLDEINIWYEIGAAKPLSIEVAPIEVALTEKALDEAALQYTCRRIEGADGVVHKSVVIVPPAIPAAVALHADYASGVVTATLNNVDRFGRIALEFPNGAIGEPALEDLIHLILGESTAFLHRAPLAGIRGRPND
jgi:hypothetical protein